MLRSKSIKELSSKLQRQGYPRLEMTALVAATGAAGFLGSWVMLHAGVNSMALRYPLALGCAYIAFLLLLALWLHLRGAFGSASVDVAVDLGDISVGNLRPGSTAFAGMGGTFDGAGASANFDAGDMLGDCAGNALQAEEGAIPLLALLAIGAVALSLFVLAFSLVATAPLLFAELMVDGAMSATLYRRLHRGAKHHWMAGASHHWSATAIRRTILPFLLASILLTGAGFVMQVAVPGARSVGEVLHPPR